MLQSYAKEKNNTIHEEDHGGIRLRRTQCLPLSSHSGSTPGDVRWCPSLALCSLSETASIPVCGCLLYIWLVPTGLPCQLSISPGPRSGSFNDPRGLPVPSPPVSRGGLVDQEGGSMGHPWRTLFSPRGGSESVSPSLATHLGLSQILSNNVWVRVN